jgi:cytochrome c
VIAPGRVLRSPVSILAWALVLAGVLTLPACAGGAGDPQAIVVPNGDPERGRAALQAAGCGACHRIPGLVDASATVGPPLDGWRDRVWIAGLLRNNPENLVNWIQSPQSIKPGNAMPDMGISEEDARDMAAYLYTLEHDPD